MGTPRLGGGKVTETSVLSFAVEREIALRIRHIEIDASSASTV